MQNGFSLTMFDDGREMISHRFTAVESGEKVKTIFYDGELHELDTMEI